MLDPAPLLGTLRLHVEGSAEELGRQADVVQGTLRDPQPDPGLWPGADQYRLLVDRQYGILLRAEALLAGECMREPRSLSSCSIDRSRRSASCCRCRAVPACATTGSFA